jgi:hypothetical protein
VRDLKVDIYSLACRGGMGETFGGHLVASFLDVETGKIETVRVTALDCVETGRDPNDLSDAEYDHLPNARRVLGNKDRYFEIPRWKTLPPHDARDLSAGILLEIRNWLHSIGINLVS